MCRTRSLPRRRFTGAALPAEDQSWGADPAEDAERVSALYRSLPIGRDPRSADLSLVLDATVGTAPEQALDLLRRLARRTSGALFEQPVARQDRLGLLDVARPVLGTHLC